MKTTKILAMFVAVFGIVVCSAGLIEAAPVGTAFTYQGRLIDANDAADGLYDFQFKLYDSNDPCDCNQIGRDVNLPDMDVIDGYFTVALDFNDASAFNGDARWLQIGVRAGDLNDPNVYTTLSPRQEVTPTPHAVYAETAGADNDWQISGNDMYSIPSGNVGIGTTTPTSELHIARDENNLVGIHIKNTDTGSLSMEGIILGNENGDLAGLLAYDDDSASYPSRMNLYNNRSSGSIGLVTSGSNRMLVANNGNVGIGTTTPDYKLHVDGGDGPAIMGTSNNSHAIWGLSHSIGGSYAGVLGETGNEGSYGVFGLDSQGGSSIGVFGRSSTDGTAGLFYSEYGDGLIVLKGNVGIGVLDPWCKLEVHGGDDCAIHAESNADYGIWGRSSGRSYAGVVGLTGSADSWGVYGSDSHGGLAVRGRSNTDGTAGSFYSASGYGLIVEKGNVGIGTQSPSDGLHVVDSGYLQARFESTDSAGGIRLVADTGQSYELQALPDDHAIADGFIFYDRSEGAYRIVIDANGHVGIGDTTPSYQLDVAGDIQCVNLHESSDERLKSSVSPLANVLEKVQMIRGVSFEWNELAESFGASTGARQIGIIAQELETVLPEVVSEDAAGYKSVAYSKLTVVLVEAVKELKAENDDLKQRIRTLEAAMGDIHPARANQMNRTGLSK